MMKHKDILPLELRAINYLVNEYLLDHHYRLTAITFSEENEEQVLTYLLLRLEFSFLILIRPGRGVLNNQNILD